MHFVTRETGYTRNIRLGRGIKGWEYVSPPPIVVLSKVVVSVPLESTKRYAGVNEDGGGEGENNISALESNQQRHATTIRTYI